VCEYIVCTYLCHFYASVYFVKNMGQQESIEQRGSYQPSSQQQSGSGNTLSNLLMMCDLDASDTCGSREGTGGQLPKSYASSHHHVTSSSHAISIQSVAGRDGGSIIDAIDLSTSYADVDSFLPVPISEGDNEFLFDSKRRLGVSSRDLARLLPCHPLYNTLFVCPKFCRLNLNNDEVLYYSSDPVQYSPFPTVYLRLSFGKQSTWISRITSEEDLIEKLEKALAHCDEHHPQIAFCLFRHVVELSLLAAEECQIMLPSDCYSDLKDREEVCGKRLDCLILGPMLQGSVGPKIQDMITGDATTKTSTSEKQNPVVIQKVVDIFNSKRNNIAIDEELKVLNIRRSQAIDIVNTERKKTNRRASISAVDDDSVLTWSFKWPLKRGGGTVVVDENGDTQQLDSHLYAGTGSEIESLMDEGILPKQTETALFEPPSLRGLKLSESCDRMWDWLEEATCDAYNASSCWRACVKFIPVVSSSCKAKYWIQLAIDASALENDFDSMDYAQRSLSEIQEVLFHARVTVKGSFTFLQPTVASTGGGGGSSLGFRGAATSPSIFPSRKASKIPSLDMRKAQVVISLSHLEGGSSRSPPRPGTPRTSLTDTSWVTPSVDRDLLAKALRFLFFKNCFISFVNEFYISFNIDHWKKRKSTYH